MDRKVKEEARFDLILLVTKVESNHLIVSDGINHIEAYPAQGTNQSWRDLESHVCAFLGVTVEDSVRKEKR